MRICLRGKCKLTGEKNNVCCLECDKKFTCRELGRCTEDTETDWNKCSKLVSKER